MTVANTSNVAKFNGNSSTTSFPFAFAVFATTDVVVVLTSATAVETVQSVSTHYTVSINANQDSSPGGVITMLTAPATGKKLTVFRDLVASQGVDLANQGTFYPEVIEDGFDRLTMLVQELEERVARSPILPVSTGVTGSLGISDPVANQTLQFNATANGIEASGYSTTSLASNVAAAQASEDNASQHEDDALTAKNNAVTAQGLSEGARDASITAKNDSVTAKNDSVTAKNDSVTAKNDSETAQGLSEDARDASITAKNTSVTAKNASVTAQGLSEDARDASITAKNDSVTAKNASVTAQGLSEDAKGDSETARDAAQAAAASLVTSLDNFDDKYLGAKSSEPSVDNDGEALVLGALYFLTGTGMQVYDGSVWIAASSSGTSSLFTYEYIATAGQTSFSGVDVNGQTLSYSANNIHVTYGGLDIPVADYVATNGTAVVLDDGAVVGTIVRIVAFKSFTVADTYTKAQTDAKVVQGEVFYENAMVITTNYTITTNKNAMTAGPITVNSGVTVTVPNNSTWTIV